MPALGTSQGLLGLSVRPAGHREKCKEEHGAGDWPRQMRSDFGRVLKMEGQLYYPTTTPFPAPLQCSVWSWAHPETSRR